MGACASSTSKGNLIVEVDGGNDEFRDLFIEGDVLGEGEFGQVKKVSLKRSKEGNEQQQPLACKYLKKGMQFKDNTLYPALDPTILRGEIEMLRALEGKQFCLQLHSLFETPRQILMITELCSGGEMMEWVSKQEEDLKTEDVSRIAYQLLSAIDHCAKHSIIHRDIKAENIMFKEATAGSELRLIDFGAGTNRPPSGDNPNFHTTFAGSPFYLSPEMFQHTYTYKTDVWSVGVTLYVLVAGFPSESLQKAFNILQSSKKGRDLRSLPNLPENMPDSYFDLMDQLLVYRHKQRKAAGEVLGHPFVTFHLRPAEGEEDKDHVHDEILPMQQPPRGRLSMLKNVSFSGSVRRHSTFLDYQKYERNVTTLLATMLSKSAFEQLLLILKERLIKQNNITNANANANANASPKTSPLVLTDTSMTSTATQTLESEGEDISFSGDNNQGCGVTVCFENLGVIPIHVLKDILKDEIKNMQIVSRMETLQNASSYDKFAYNISMLKDFTASSTQRISTTSPNATPTNGSRGGQIQNQQRRSVMTKGTSIGMSFRGFSNSTTNKKSILGMDSSDGGIAGSSGTGAVSARQRFAALNQNKRAMAMSTRF